MHYSKLVVERQNESYILHAYITGEDEPLYSKEVEEVCIGPMDVGVSQQLVLESAQSCEVNFVNKIGGSYNVAEISLP